MQGKKPSFASKPRKRKRNRSYKKLITFLLVAVFIAIFYGIFLSPVFTINDFSLGGNEDVKYSQVREVLEESLDKKYGLVIPANGFFLIKPVALENSLVEKIPKVMSADIVRLFPDRLNITIEERDPRVIWKTAGRHYIVGSDGLVSSQIYETLEGVPVVSDDSNSLVSANDKLLKEEYLDFVIELSDSFNARTGLEVKSLSTPSSQSRDLFVKTKKGFKIYLSSGLTFDSQVERLLTILGVEVAEESQKDLDYIDLRIKDRVYYKYK